MNLLALDLNLGIFDDLKNDTNMVRVSFNQTDSGSLPVLLGFFHTFKKNGLQNRVASHSMNSCDTFVIPFS